MSQRLTRARFKTAVPAGLGFWLLVLAAWLDGAALSAARSATSEAAALAKLGEMVLDGKHLKYDPSEALAYFSKAAALGSATARLRLAEMSVRGISAEPDAGQALREITQLARDGSQSALVSLGDIYARGYAGFICEEAALAAYEKAAGEGNVTAALRLAEIYRYGLFGSEDQDRAYAYLEQARAQENSYALYLIGDGMIDRDFRKFGTAQSGLDLIREARELGVGDAEIALAIRRDNRTARLLPRSQILSTLTAMADAGNVDAALYLFDFYLDPKNWRSRRLPSRNLKSAQNLLEKVAVQLEPGELAYRRLLLEILAARPSNLEELFPRIETIAPGNRPSLFRRVLRGNPNAFFYFVQMQLARDGLYQGPVDGYLKRRTISAIKDYCERLGAKPLCRRGPLSVQTTHLLIHSF